MEMNSVSAKRRCRFSGRMSASQYSYTGLRVDSDASIAHMSDLKGQFAGFRRQWADSGAYPDVSRRASQELDREPRKGSM
jgi:hypothetical protein